MATDAIASLLAAVEPARDVKQRVSLARLIARVRKTPSVPISVGRYELLHAVGAGALGTVFAARDPSLDRVVAVKLVEGRASVNVRLDEARTLAQLADPSIVQVLDAGTYDPATVGAGSLGTSRGIYIVTELIEGQTLDEWASKRRSWSHVIETYLGAASGLAAAHDAGVVHRDFKPANAIVDRQGRVRVLDFGLACARDDPAQAEVAGTPAYMAPEQLAGRGATDRSDQYAWAVACFEALHGRRPFAGDTLEELAAAQHQGSPLARVSERVAPLRIYAVLERALDAEQHERFASMRELMDDLRRARPSRSAAIFAVAGLLAAGAAVAAWPEIAADETAPSAVAAPAVADASAGWDALERATALLRKGKYVEARALGADTKAFAAVVGVPTLEARACRVMFWAEHYIGDATKASALAERCYEVAAAAGVDGDAAWLATDIVFSLGTQSRYDEAAIWFEHAQAATDRVDDNVELESILAQRRGELALYRHDPVEAENCWRESAALAQKVFAPDHPQRGRLMAMIGAALEEQGRSDEALAIKVEGQRRLEAALGPDHPDLVTGLVNIGASLISAEPLQAVALLQRAEEIVHGHGLVGAETTALQNNLGRALESSGDTQGALVHYELALAVHEAAGRTAHAEVAVLHFNVGRLLARMGQPAEAVGHLERSVESMRSAGVADHPRVVDTLVEAAGAYLDLDRPVEADSALARAAAIAGSPSEATLQALVAVRERVDAARLRRRD